MSNNKRDSLTVEVVAEHKIEQILKTEAERGKSDGVITRQEYKLHIQSQQLEKLTPEENKKIEAIIPEKGLAIEELGKKILQGLKDCSKNHKTINPIEYDAFDPLTLAPRIKPQNSKK